VVDASAAHVFAERANKSSVIKLKGAIGTFTFDPLFETWFAGERSMRGDIRRVLAMAAGCLLAALAHSRSPTQPAQPSPVVFHQETVRKPDVYIETYVTGYNTVATQTDGTPCIGAAGTYICGRNDVVACPPLLKLGTAVEIGGKRYVCEDRTSRKYRDRFDINCNQDKSCPYKVASWTMVKLLF
jgi:hypothetical protein